MSDPHGAGVVLDVARRRLEDAAAGTDARRLFHGRGGVWPGLEDVLLDRFGATLRLGVHGELDDALLAALSAGTEALGPSFGLRGAWLQRRGEPGAPSTRLWGAPEPDTVVREAGLRYHVHPGEGRNAGLFLDAAPVRDWLRREARALRVLNLFSYTCSLSVAALAGGAAEVVNVDMARGALRTGERNHRTNDLAGARFLPHDLFSSWGRLKRLGPFDLVLVDPPMRQGRSFEATRDWPRVLRRLAGLLTARGRALTILNSPFTTRATFAGLVAVHAPELRAVPGSPPPSADFDESDPERGLKIDLWERDPGFRAGA